ncbi:MAG: glycosyltransferase family 39 protein [Deltaproteobacteria bacterium]|nr:glycosyltransferase family 39 protein [Deltaproteobacteria bacterium]MBW2698240.1 glycosyltransferase family 39 protein [Deltaproteobacteria bacterium]
MNRLANALAPRWGWLGLVLLISFYAVLAGSSAQRKSVTVDELGHLPSGLHYLRTGDARYASLNPPLINLLSATPVLLLDLEKELVAPPASNDPFSFWEVGYEFQQRHAADYQRIFDAARVVPIGIVAALGLLAFVWARQLVPDAPNAAGLFAAGLICLSPNVLAQARLIGTDTGTAFFVALSMWTFRAMLLRPTPGATLLCGATLGLAQLTKFYALLLYPSMLGVVVGWHLLSRDPKPRLDRLLWRSAAAGCVSLLVLNTGYLWQEFGASLSALELQSSMLLGWQASMLGSVPIPLPGAFIRALDAQWVEVGTSMPSFLLGESFQGGRWYYYLVLLAIKTPLPLMLSFGLALGLSIARRSLPRRELLLLWTYPLLLFALLSLGQARQLGARALLSAVPMLQLWTAATLVRTGAASKRRPAILCAVAVAVAWTAAVSLASHPDYLSYFNPLIGGSANAYRYASDANVDIGQDLIQLAEYLEREGMDGEPLQLLYFGSVDPALYGIDYQVPEKALRPGLLAVSVSLYRLRYPMLDHGALREVGPIIVEGLGPPIASIGGSIHLYRVPGKRDSDE